MAAKVATSHPYRSSFRVYPILPNIRLTDLPPISQLPTEQGRDPMFSKSTQIVLK